MIVHQLVIDNYQEQFPCFQSLQAATCTYRSKTVEKNQIITSQPVGRKKSKQASTVLTNLNLMTSCCYCEFFLMAGFFNLLSKIIFPINLGPAHTLHSFLCGVFPWQHEKRTVDYYWCSNVQYIGAKGIVEVIQHWTLTLQKCILSTALPCIWLEHLDLACNHMNVMCVSFTMCLATLYIHTVWSNKVHVYDTVLPFNTKSWKWNPVCMFRTQFKYHSHF